MSDWIVLLVGLMAGILIGCWVTWFAHYQSFRRKPDEWIATLEKHREVKELEELTSLKGGK